jgi:hypothetical protein
VAYPALQKRIANRRPLIERLRQAETRSNGAALLMDFLDNLRVVKLPHLQIHYRLQLGAKSVATKPETMTAKLIPNTNTLYVASDLPGTEPPWPAVARELALAIKQDRAVGALAIGIKEVLAAETFEAAAQILDELGYP